MSEFKPNIKNEITANDLHAFCDFDTSEPLPVSNLKGITAGIKTEGPISFAEFLGKMNFKIRSSVLANNLGAVGMQPWGGSNWPDPFS